MTDRTSAEEARARLLEGGTLHWFHWAVVIASLCITLAASWASQSQVDDKNAEHFEQEVKGVVALISDRLSRYEDALWGGVGVVRSRSHGLSLGEWREYAETIRMAEKYPGINGIGVIRRVFRPDKADFVAAQWGDQPEFEIFPEHAFEELLPITFIEPLASNRAAVGLDIAHESNRLRAALAARDSGAAQITGPIVLVQDATKTPGFLFYTPFYVGKPTTDATRREAFAGLVYAPFVVNKLMEGLLRRELRSVAVRITDGDTVIYDEMVGSGPTSQRDPEPLFQTTQEIGLYGRSWHVEFQTDLAFRASASSAQPVTVLVAGLFIDGLLLLLFVSISRASSGAVAFADQANAALVQKIEALAKSNQDLEQFAYVASHDLREPLRMVVSYNELIAKRYADQLDDRGRQFIDFAVGGAQRMAGLLDGLLAYSRIAMTEQPAEIVDCERVVGAVLQDLSVQIEEAGAEVVVGELPLVVGDNVQLRQVFQNLISNALKFHGEAPPHIELSARQEGANWVISVKDQGIGLDPAFSERMFTIFQRLNPRDEYPGSGVGLAVVKRIIERHGGRIWVESALGEGATFLFELRGGDDLT